MIVYYFREDGVYLNSGDVLGPGWPANATPSSPLPIPDGNYAVWGAPNWSYVQGEIPPYPPISEIQAQNKSEATALLSATDWTAPSSIADPVESQPYLANRQAFLAYRSQVREIAVNPPSTLVTDWPTLPKEEWAYTQ